MHPDAPSASPTSASDLHAMWQFPATHKLLVVLSAPLAYNPPSPSDLENALLHPRDHLQLLASLHGRLLGISAGISAAKKWFAATARFLRKHPAEFACLSSLSPSASASDLSHITLSHFRDPVQHASTHFVFPTHLDAYFDDLSPVLRLLILHLVAELVVAQYDSLLSAGSFADIPVDDLRVPPLGTDALGNVYWYFGDADRVYREPPHHYNKQLLLPPIIHSHAAAPHHPTTITSQHPSVSSPRRPFHKLPLGREESKLVEDIFGDDHISPDSVEVLGNLGRDPTTPDPSVVPPPTPAGPVRRTSARRNLQRLNSQNGLGNGHHALPKPPSEISERARPKSQRAASRLAAIESSAENATTNGRRVSGRRRKAPDRHGVGNDDGVKPPATMRTSKRPRTVEPQFVDATLRKCVKWETLTTGSEMLGGVVEQFEAETGGARWSERVLLRKLRDEVLPEVCENETRTKRTLDRKMKAEMLSATQKRSTRLEAISVRRAEEARRMAAEEEREKEEQMKLDEHERRVAENLDVAEGELSMLIRCMRRKHGMEEAIARDDVGMPKVKMEKKVVGTRRSMRRTGEDGKEEVAQGSEGEEMEVDGEGSGERKEGVGEIGGALESEIGDEFTWRKGEDGRRWRVLNKFMFVGGKTFEEVGLEEVGQEGSGGEEVIGVGIVMPPRWSAAEVKTVEVVGVREWVIEFGREPKQWVRGGEGWYELGEAAWEYRTKYASARRKFELCARVGVMGETMRAWQLGYKAVVELLGMRYGEMEWYREEDVLREKGFMVEQLGRIERKSIAQSGFLRELRSKVRAERRKGSGRKRKVPRAVSSIISGLVRAATRRRSGKGLVKQEGEEEGEEEVAEGKG